MNLVVFHTTVVKCSKIYDKELKSVLLEKTSTLTTQSVYTQAVKQERFRVHQGNREYFSCMRLHRLC